MVKYINKVCLQGLIGHVVRHKSNKKVSLWLGLNLFFKDCDGNFKSEVSWHECEVFADEIKKTENIKIGDCVRIIGFLKNYSFIENKDNPDLRKKVRKVVVVKNIEIIKDEINADTKVKEEMVI